MKKTDWIEKLSKIRCSNCGRKDILPGPFYDRFSVRCQTCGQKFRVKLIGKK